MKKSNIFKLSFVPLLTTSLLFWGGVNQSFAETNAGAVIQNTNPTDMGPGQWPDPRFVEATEKTATGEDPKLCAGALYDKLTGMMWMKNGSSGGSRNWADANTYANGLSLCGYSDWRLPNINVLSSLVNTSDTTSPASWLNSNGFTGIMQSYWSSTVYSLSGGYAWGVYMSFGAVGYYNQTDDSSVLPVRGPS